MRDLIKKILKEAVGVPKDVEIAAENLYNDIINKLKSIGVDELNEKMYLPNTDGRYSFAGFEPTRIQLEIDLGEYDPNNQEGIEGERVAGMGVTSSSNVDADFVIISHNIRDVDLNIEFIVPEGHGDIIPSQIANYLKKEKAESLPSLAHELMHSYERHSTPKESLKRRAVYSIESSFRTPITSLNEFLFGLYYTNEVENYVRSTEVYTLLKLLNTDQKNFLKMLNSSEPVKKLLKYRNYSYEDLKKSLYNDMESVNKIIDNVEGYTGPVNTDEEKVEAVLDIIHNAFMRAVFEKVSEYGQIAVIRKDPMAMFRAMLTGGLDDEGLKKIIKDSTRFRDDYEKWYKYEINKMNKVVDQMYRKLSKLYSLMEKEPPTIKLETFDPVSFEMDQLVKRGRPSKIIYSNRSR